MTSVLIQAEVPPGPSIQFGMRGDSSYTRGGSGTGGWQIVDRPRRKTTGEWLDWNQFQLTLPLIIEGNGQSIEAVIAEVESWELPPGGGIQPPVLGIGGPVPHTDLQWVVFSLTWNEAIRDVTTGQRTQQLLDLVLLEYSPATALVLSPAEAAAQSSSATTGSGGSQPVASGGTYVVKQGDNLSTIAATQLGDWQRWTQIAALNGIRDPNFVAAGPNPLGLTQSAPSTAFYVGQVLQMPAR